MWVSVTCLHSPAALVCPHCSATVVGFSRVHCASCRQELPVTVVREIALYATPFDARPDRAFALQVCMVTLYLTTLRLSKGTWKNPILYQPFNDECAYLVRVPHACIKLF